MNASPAPGPAERLAPGALAVLIAAAAVGWLHYGLTGRSISTDDGISLLAAQGIREHGYPLLASGQIYDRGYLAHYVLAASTALFGASGFGILAASWAAALAVLPLVFGLGRRTLGDPVAGLLGAALLVPCGAQIYYATSPRFYELLALFSTWAVYAAWRGYGQGSAPHRWQAILAVALGLQCELGAGTLAVALPVALVASAEGPLRERIGRLWPRGYAEPAALVALGVSVALVAIRPVDHIAFIVAGAGKTISFVGLNLGPWHLAEHLVTFDGILPGTLPLVVGGFAAAWALPELRRPGFVFLATAWVVAFLQVAVVMNLHAHRFLMFLLPLYALLAAHGAVSIVRAARIALREGRRAGWAPALASAAALAGGLAAVGYAYETERIWLRQLYETGWGLPGDPNDGALVFKRELLKVKPKIAEGDLVLSSNPWVSDHYLGRTDGILRQRRTETGWGRFDVDRDEYFGTDVVDEVAEVEWIVKTLSPGQSLWLVIDRKLLVSSSEEFQAFLADRGPQVNKSRRLRVYRVTRGAPLAPPAP